MNNKFIFVCNFYNPPKGIQYRYDFNDFERILSAKPNKRDGCILCGDLNFPSTDWHTLLSNSEEESRNIDLLGSIIIQQDIKVPTCSCNTLDVAFCELSPTLLKWMKISTKSMTVLIMSCNQIVSRLFF